MEVCSPPAVACKPLKSLPNGSAGRPMSIPLTGKTLKLFARSVSAVTALAGCNAKRLTGLWPRSAETRIIRLQTNPIYPMKPIPKPLKNWKVRRAPRPALLFRLFTTRAELCIRSSESARGAPANGRPSPGSRPMMKSSTVVIFSAKGMWTGWPHVAI